MGTKRQRQPKKDATTTQGSDPSTNPASTITNLPLSRCAPILVFLGGWLSSWAATVVLVRSNDKNEQIVPTDASRRTGNVGSVKISNDATVIPPNGSSSDTFIYVVDDALSAEFCDSLVARFSNDDRRVAGRAGKKDSEIKNSIDLPLTLVDDYRDEVRVIRDAADRALVDYAHRYPHLVFGAVTPSVIHPERRQYVDLTDELWERGVGTDRNPRTMGGTLQLIKMNYRHGHLNMQWYKQTSGHYSKWHSEHMPHWEEDGPIHRVLLWMVYLNDVAEGGTTDFYYQNKQIQPKKGRLVIAPASFTHTHRGSPPVSGDKYIVTSWLMWKNVKQLGWDRFAKKQ